MFVTELEGGTLTSSAGVLVSLLVRLFSSSGGGSVERGVAEWIAEARCWVLRNRAGLRVFRLDCFFKGHGSTG